MEGGLPLALLSNVLSHLPLRKRACDQRPCHKPTAAEGPIRERQPGTEGKAAERPYLRCSSNASRGVSLHGPR
jgi:hypothetical protein